MCFRNLVRGPLTLNPGAGNDLIVDICRFLTLLIVSKIQPSPDSLTQAKPNAHGVQISFYENFNLTETSQVALFAAGYMSDMSVPYRVVILVDFFFDPNLDDKRVGVKFGRPISTQIFPVSVGHSQYHLR